MLMSRCCGAGVVSVESDRSCGFAGQRITKSDTESTCPAGLWLAGSHKDSCGYSNGNAGRRTDSGCAEE